MKYVARVGKVWQDKRTGKILGREIEIKNEKDIIYYKMVKEPTKKAAKETDTPLEAKEGK